MKKNLAKVAVCGIGFLLLTSVVFATEEGQGLRFRSDRNRLEVAQDLRDRTGELREQYRQERERFEESKRRFREARREGTQEARREALEKAKKYILKALERATNRLQKLAERIQNSPVISPDRKTELLNQIQGKITELNNARSQVEGATSFNELREAMRNGRNQVGSARELVKKVVQAILASHIDKAIAKLEEIATRLEGRINELKARGVNTARFEQSLKEVRVKLTRAKDANKAGNYRGARRQAEEARAILAKLNGQLTAAGAKLKGGTPSATTGATP